MKLMFASGWFELWIAATHTLSDKLVRKERFQKSHLFAAFAASSSAPCSRCGNWSCNSCGLDGVVWRNLPRTSSTISYSHQSLANFETKTIAFQKPAATWCLSPQCETVADQTRLSLLTFGDFFLKFFFSFLIGLFGLLSHSGREWPLPTSVWSEQLPRAPKYFSTSVLWHNCLSHVLFLVSTNFAPPRAQQRKTRISLYISNFGLIKNLYSMSVQQQNA